MSTLGTCRCGKPFRSKFQVVRGKCAYCERKETARLADMERLCACGHENGNHSTTGPCLGATPGDGDCWRGCQNFREVKRGE